MKLKLKLLLLSVFSLIMFTVSSFAQSKTATGTVVDEKSGSPISGASIVAKGTKYGTSTDVDGKFILNYVAATNDLVISAVGYATQTLAASNGVVKLKAVNASLGDVVVVAYGTRKKGDLTSSVTQISSKDFQKGNIASAEQLLVGKAPGLQVVSGGGSAGGGSKIRIRGGASLNASNDPLIVIDGVPIDGNGIAGNGNLLNSINPNDIESMSILKDAAATALYGSRGSNGVILITTKKGTKGAIKYNFNTLVSVGSNSARSEVLTADEIRQYVTQDALNTGVNTYKNKLGAGNTNWQDLIYQNAIGLDNTISAAGAIGKVPFRASLGHLEQTGVLKTNKFARNTFGLNLNPKLLNNNLAVNFALKFSNTQNRFADEGAIGAAVSFDPTQDPNNGSKYGGYFEWLEPNGEPVAIGTRNPVSLLKQRNNKSTVNRILTNVQLDYKIKAVEGLHLLANLGIDYAKGSGNDNRDSTYAGSFATRGRYAEYSENKNNTLINLGVLYEKQLPSIRSKFDLLFTHEYQAFKNVSDNFANFDQKGILIPGSEPAFAQGQGEYRLESYLGRINYTFDNNYLLSATLRSDASSKLNPDGRLGYFPAVAFAWKIKDALFKSSKVFSDLRLRASWGKTGQQSGIGEYSYLPRYTTGTGTAQYQLGNQFITVGRPEGYISNLTWEKTATSNLGLDFGILKNRITGTFDIYSKKTTDLLGDVTLAPGSNFAISATKNIGALTSEGFEFGINTIPVQTEKVTWNMGFNFSRNTIKITKLLDDPRSDYKGVDVNGIDGGTGNSASKHQVGYAPYTYFLYKQVYDAAGKPLQGVYADLNRDGNYGEDDRIYSKKPNADFFIGFNTDITIKKFNIGVTGHGSFGNYVYNNRFSNNSAFRNLRNPLEIINNVSREFLNSQFSANEYLSDYWLENGSFFRIDNINLGYNVGKISKSVGLRLNAAIQNVAIFTKYKGLDPEVANNGIDNNIYPRPRIFSIGANLDF